MHYLIFQAILADELAGGDAEGVVKTGDDDKGAARRKLAALRLVQGGDADIAELCHVLDRQTAFFAESFYILAKIGDRVRRFHARFLSPVREKR